MLQRHQRGRDGLRLKTPDHDLRGGGDTGRAPPLMSGRQDSAPTSAKGIHMGGPSRY